MPKGNTMTLEEYVQAIMTLSHLFDNPPELDTPEGDRFSELIDEVVAYEDIHYPMNKS